MKKIQLSLICLFFSLLPLMAQAPSTQGTEFWIAFMQNEKTPTLSFAVSAENACQLVAFDCVRGTGAFHYTSFGGTSIIPAGLTQLPNLPLNAYVTSSETVEDKVFRIEFSDDVSLFASNYVEKLFDNAAILPTTALRDEYIIQTYVNSEKKSSYPPEFLIVATEDNTEVEITPTWKTKGNHPAGTMFTVTLQRGQSYQVQAEAVQGSDLSGSIVKARNGKKIAVFNGNQSEAIGNPYPSQGSSGDHLFEQAMPVAYWGTQFALTRTQVNQQDVVRVTAKNNNTTLTLDGVDLGVTLVSGQTYDIVIPQSSSTGREAYFLETSCPCAVYQYMETNHAENASGDKVGDPSMVWISPIEQMIKKINFCTYQTGVTNTHFVNIVTRTNNVSSVTLTGVTSGAQALTFYPIIGNSLYSYARVSIADDSYSLQGNEGVIAFVYGLGENESYAYSAGSSVKVQNGITINDMAFSPGETSTISYCWGDTLSFTSNVKDATISWDMDDGVTLADSSFIYFYDTPGLYRVEAYIHRFSNPCDGSSIDDTVRVYIKMSTPQKIHYYETICEDGLTNHDAPTTRIDTIEYNCDSIVYRHLTVNYNADTILYFRAKDALDINGVVYTESTQITETLPRMWTDCDSVITYNIEVLHCLDVVLDNTMATACGDDEGFSLPYTINRGTFSDFWVDFNAKAMAVGFDSTMISKTDDSFYITLPDNVVPNRYSATIRVVDTLCNEILSLPFEFEVLYPASVFAQKWNDVLAVYNADYNGGYTFTDFQWYKNGSPIEGATGSYYYTESGLEMESEYSVELTRASDGVVLMSCSRTPRNTGAVAANIMVHPTIVPATDNISVEVSDDAVVTYWNAMGIQKYTIEVSAGLNSVRVPSVSGIYLMSVQLANGQNQVFYIMVK